MAIKGIQERGKYCPKIDCSDWNEDDGFLGAKIRQWMTKELRRRFKNDPPDAMLYITSKKKFVVSVSLPLSDDNDESGVGFDFDLEAIIREFSEERFEDEIQNLLADRLEKLVRQLRKKSI